MVKALSIILFIGIDMLGDSMTDEINIITPYQLLEMFSEVPHSFQVLNTNSMSNGMVLSPGPDLNRCTCLRISPAW